jgi:hypothetical protein
MVDRGSMAGMENCTCINQDQMISGNTDCPEHRFVDGRPRCELPQEVWKYPLPNDSNAISLPGVGKTLSVGLQKLAKFRALPETPVVWCLVTPGRELTVKEFFVRLTGEKMAPNGDRFIGTLQREDGIVLHVFERIR